MKKLSVITLLLWTALLLSTPSAPAVAAAEPVESCPMWRIAGTQIIYRCEDDSTGVVCLSQGIMLFCVQP